MRRQTFTWICDICEHRLTDVLSHEKPKGWIEFSVEHPQEERSFLDKAICGDCLEVITRKLNEGTKP